RSAARVAGFKNFFIKNLNHVINLFGGNSIELNDKIPRAVQVKEKFGGLRFYVRPSNSKIIAIVSRYEALSYNICMKCGAKDGSLRKDKSWWMTLCDECNKFRT
ncbi:MAG TPA: hypothetical protein VM577_11450, partial [Anaerovoracaceae bacterium]|nr:hypothetical protein [Anaerovoracaceae bacterium]